MTTSLIALFDRDLARLKQEIELYPETELWKTLPGITNSAGNLTLHICGNLKHFIGAQLGNSGYIREREKEFADKNVSKSALYDNIDQTRQVISKTLGSLSDKNLDSTYPLQMWGKEITTEFFLIHLQSHLNYHLGQINYLRRIQSSKEIN
ncbi:MAG: DUF1572 family protein [Fulvivirga sp.]|nr:DUF1572 family protein [Fulvivirga sp.]